MAEGKEDLSSFDNISDRVERAKAKAEAMRRARAGRADAPQAPTPQSEDAEPQQEPADRGRGDLTPTESPSIRPVGAASAGPTPEEGQGPTGQKVGVQRTPAPASIRPGLPLRVPVADGGMTTRRGFLSWLTLAWTAFLSASLAGLVALGRFMFPNVLFEPPQSFKIGFPDEYEIGVDTRWKDKYGIWIVRNAEGMYALMAVCTHLGCIPNWLANEAKFKCPCHGSGFYVSGISFEGPAPRPLERVRIVLADDGQILVDKNRKYLYEKGGWDQPESFLGI